MYGARREANVQNVFYLVYFCTNSESLHELLVYQQLALHLTVIKIGKISLVYNLGLQLYNWMGSREWMRDKVN